MALHIHRGAICLCVLIAVGGCGRRNHPPTIPVTGTVTYEGQSVAGAGLTFIPQSDGASTDKNRPARGTTDERGQFRLQTYFGPGSDVDGAMAGVYTVTIIKVDAPSGPIDPEKYRPPRSQLPEHYGDPAHSGLTATVQSDAPNNFEFKLVKEGEKSGR